MHVCNSDKKNGPLNFSLLNYKLRNLKNFQCKAPKIKTKNKIKIQNIKYLKSLNNFIIFYTIKNTSREALFLNIHKLINNKHHVVMSQAALAC